MCTFRKVAAALDDLSKRCPRYEACTYRDKGEKCLQDRGGDCYQWFLNAGRQQDEGRL